MNFNSQLNGLIRTKIIIFKKNRSVETKIDFYSQRNGSFKIRNNFNPQKRFC